MCWCLLYVVLVSLMLGVSILDVGCYHFLKCFLLFPDRFFVLLL